MGVLTSARASKVIARAKLDFQNVEDTRAYRGNKPKSLDVIMRLLVAGFACGKMVLRSIEDLSADIDPTTRKKMGLAGRISDTCLYEMLERTPTAGFRETLWKGLRRDLDSKAITNDLFAGGAVAYDGKGAGSGWGEAPNGECRTLKCDDKGTELWDVFALRACLISSSARPVIDQELIPSKKGEATTFASILERDVKRFPRLFRYVTGDAGLASARNAQKVIDLLKLYLFQIKENFGKLYPLALSLLDKAKVVAQTTEHYQGYVVKRELRRVKTPSDVSFPGAKQFLGVRQIRTYDDGSIETEDRVYITAIPWHELKPSKLLQLVRLHWGIENGANWTADMILQEDSRRPCYKGFGPNVTSWLILLAYNLISVFRTHLPKKDNNWVSWERSRELIYQAVLGVVHQGRSCYQATLV